MTDSKTKKHKSTSRKRPGVASVKSKKQGTLQENLRILLYSFLILFTFVLISINVVIFFFFDDLPSLQELHQFNPDAISKIYSADGKLLSELYVMKRDITSLKKIPQHAKDALLAMEDHTFYEHSGLYLKGIIRAVVVNFATMKRSQGASTITQQLARNMYDHIGFQKTYVRKFKELLTAIMIEKAYTKDEILELYLNSVYFGHGTYGIETASKYYFGKSSSELTLDEASILVGMLPAPARFSPFRHPERCLRKRNLVLSVMHNRGFISEYDLQQKKALPLPGKQKQKSERNSDYFSEYIRRQLEQIDDSLNINLYKDGLNIYTSLDSEIQDILAKHFQEGIDKNQSILNREFLKNQRKLEAALDKKDWHPDSVRAILRNGDEIPEELRNQFLVEGAALVMNPKNGEVLAMIGGRLDESYEDQFNRATQANRQPGSVFKPLVYLAAIESGASPATKLMNQPVELCMNDDCSETWSPSNWDDSSGLMTALREALKRSINVVSARVVQELITPADVVRSIAAFEFSTSILPVPSISLGVNVVKLIDITSAYCTIANDGIYTKPISITRIEDRYGRVLHDFFPKSKGIKDEADIFLIRDMMRSVVDNGTASSARWRYHFDHPAAGKTGTTDKKADAWFLGFTPNIVMGVWFGMDDPRISLGKKQYGSVAAMPVWAKTMKEIHEKKNIEKDSWDEPENIVHLEVCKDSGETASKNCPRNSRYMEMFRADNTPDIECHIHRNPLNRFRDKK